MNEIKCLFSAFMTHQLADTIDSILEQREGCCESATIKIHVWEYVNLNFDPDKTPCTYTCVWQAFETYYDTQVKPLAEEEDRVNACVKWLHDLKTRVEKIEAVDDLLPSHPCAEHRDRLKQLKLRVDEITEFVMHKFRCLKFGVD